MRRSSDCRKICVILCLWIAQSAAGAEVLRLRLDDSVKKAVAHAPLMHVATAESAAALERSQSQRGLLWPRLSLDASYRYTTLVSTVTLTSGTVSRTVSLTDYKNYSIGPVLSWNLWDSGALYYSWKASIELAGAKESERLARQRLIELNARLAYFAVQNLAERVSLLTDSVRVARAQEQDVLVRLKAGSSSRMDVATARQQVLLFLSQLKQAQADFTGAIRDLFALTGDKVPESADVTSLNAEFDPISDSLKSFKQVSMQVNPGITPTLRAAEASSTAAELAVSSARTGHWPKVSFSAKSSIDYPNGPEFKNVQQNAFSLLVSWGLFEGGRVKHDIAEKRMNAEAASERFSQVRVDLARDFAKARDQLESAQAQTQLNREAVSEATELARLVYESYRNGRSSFLDVQSANLKAFESRVQLVRTETQALMQLAILQNLSDGG